MIRKLAIAGYRSIRSLILELGQLNVITGPNGCGKSNLYRALKLLADTADGQLIPSLAREGGFESVLWAGPPMITHEMITGESEVLATIRAEPMLRSQPVSLRLGLMAEPFSYSIDLGLPSPSRSMFSLDSEIKRECLWLGAGINASAMCADRRGAIFRCRNKQGAWRKVELDMLTQTSMLAAYADPFAAPEVISMREMLRSWRFYDTFRTDAQAPARRPAIGTFTPVMSADGGDLPAALQTIYEIGDHRSLAQTIDDAFPGSQIHIQNSSAGMQLLLEQPAMTRDLTAAELSDGTLRYLLLVAALLTPRPPRLMVINEPENSLHPDLIPALARLIRLAAKNSQIIVVSHCGPLVEQLEADETCKAIRLDKRLGETIIPDAGIFSQRGWPWPPR